MPTLLAATTKHSLLSAYYAYLNGATEDKMMEMGFTTTEIVFVKNFHAEANGGMSFSRLVFRNKKRPKALLTKMFDMFCDWKKGNQIIIPKQRQCTVSILQARLNGATENQMAEKGFSSAEIRRIDEFIQDIHRDMTFTHRAQKTGISEHTIKRMVKLCQERSA